MNQILKIRSMNWKHFHIEDNQIDDTKVKRLPAAAIQENWDMRFTVAVGCSPH